MKRVEGQGGSETWSMGEWKVGGRLDWSFRVLSLRLQNPALGREREKGVQLIILQARIDNRELIDSHTCPLFTYFAIFSFCLDFSTFLSLQNCFVSEGATQDSSLSLRVSDTQVWQFIWSVSRPGSEDCLHLCSLAQSLSAFGQILSPPARRD